MGLHKILKIVALLLSIVGIVFWAIIVYKGDEVVGATGEGLDGILYAAYVLLAIVLITVIIFVLKGVFEGNVKNTLISVGAFLAVVLISYVLSDGTPMTIKDEVLSASGSKWVGAGLYAFYILAVIAIGAMVFGGIKKATK